MAKKQAKRTKKAVPRETKPTDDVGQNIPVEHFFDLPDVYVRAEVTRDNGAMFMYLLGEVHKPPGVIPGESFRPTTVPRRVSMITMNSGTLVVQFDQAQYANGTIDEDYAIQWSGVEIVAYPFNTIDQQKTINDAVTEKATELAMERQKPVTAEQAVEPSEVAPAKAQAPTVEPETSEMDVPTEPMAGAIPFEDTEDVIT